VVRCVHCVTLPHGMHERVSPVWLASRNLLSKYVYKQNLLKFALSSSFVLQLVQQVIFRGRLPYHHSLQSHQTLMLHLHPACTVLLLKTQYVPLIPNMPNQNTSLLL